MWLIMYQMQNSFVKDKVRVEKMVSCLLYEYEFTIWLFSLSVRKHNKGTNGVDKSYFVWKKLNKIIMALGKT